MDVDVGLLVGFEFEEERGLGFGFGFGSVDEMRVDESGKIVLVPR